MEQLQLRKGYIRCIQCAHIFDGFEAAVPTEPAHGRKRGATASPPVAPRHKAAEGEPASHPAPESGTTPTFIIPPPAADRVNGPAPAKPFTIGAGRDVAGPGMAPHSIPDVAPVLASKKASEPQMPSVLRERGSIRAVPSPSDPSFTISNPRHRDSVRRDEPVLGTHGATSPISGPQPGRDEFLEEQPFTATDADTEPEFSDDAPADDYLYIEPRAGRRSDRYKPEFLADAQRRKDWLTPVWAVLILCGLVLLVMQGVFVYRAQLANSFPGLRPTLEAACQRMGCSVPYDRRIEAIAITGSALRSNAAPEGDVSTLTLEVTLRNTYERPQEWPTLVLDLKDASGTVVVRRNLTPAVWVPPELNDGPFEAGREITVQLPVTVRGLQANGYQLDKFFP